MARTVTISIRDELLPSWERISRDHGASSWVQRMLVAWDKFHRNGSSAASFLRAAAQAERELLIQRRATAEDALRAVDEVLAELHTEHNQSPTATAPPSPPDDVLLSSFLRVDWLRKYDPTEEHIRSLAKTRGVDGDLAMRFVREHFPTWEGKGEERGA